MICGNTFLQKVFSAFGTWKAGAEYNGHYENSTFTTREKEKEADGIAAYLSEQNIKSVKMIYGQSMGSEIEIESV